MTILPFICLGIGIGLGLWVQSGAFVKIADTVSTAALIFLMLSIGLGIGLDPKIMDNLVKIGFQCMGISLSAIAFSVLFTLICEKTVIPLQKVDEELRSKKLDLYSANIESDSGSQQQSTAEKKGSGLVWLMPMSLIAGLFLGVSTRQWISSVVVNKAFVFSLIILYIGVGISQGANREVFRYVRVLGFRILWLSAAIMAGSIVGGLVAGVALDIPRPVAIISASGMSFYSITGAFMTSAYGLEPGTYGFLVNVMREFFTILLMPFLVKISIGSPIAGGAAGNMDTMLAPVTKFVGVRLGLVTLITGIILTFVVPLWLPLIAAVLY